MDASTDGSESVDQFLARIASLNSKQGEEEAERSRRAEEEMLQARKERQARRAERARSLSPSKTGPSPSLRLVGDITPSRPRGIDPPVALTPPSHSQTLGRTSSISPKPDRSHLSSIDFARPLPPQPLLDRTSAPSPPAGASSLTRSGTLSWNQRPASRGAGSLKPRPQSVTSIPDTPTNAVVAPQKTPEEVSRKDIAASLATKDPAWFRQTADRGQGSAAYRKNEFDHDMPGPSVGRGVRLPGMSRDVPTTASEEPQKPTTPSSPRKDVSPFAPHRRQDSNGPASARPASMLSLSSKSPALDLPPFKPLDISPLVEGEFTSLNRTSSVLSSPGRPPSPTKGLGGFVQSAMMKRSDSVNKRWSVQANSGLKRGDSVATSRPAHLSGIAGFSPGHSRTSSKDNRFANEGSSSPLSGSRPVSRSGPDPVSATRGRPLPQSQDESASHAKDRALSEETNLELEETVIRPSDRPTTPPSVEASLSRSPSKTLDARRWSPTKASWLESALNKPDSPRFTPSKPETPAWKLNMQRSKEQQSQQPQQSDNVGHSQKPSIAPKPLNSPPAAFQPPTAATAGSGQRAAKAGQQQLSSLEGAGASANAAMAESSSSDPPSRNVSDGPSGKPAVPSKRNITPVVTKQVSDEVTGSQVLSSTARMPDDVSNTGSIAALSSEPKIETRSLVVKPKPQTPPKTDFRAVLKSRQTAASTNANAEPEFKAVFGKLKRTQTQNYVAPDLLKDNIAKGKAALNTTGGPQPTKRVDEFKESILQKKEAMKAAAGQSGRRPESLTSIKPSEPVPEAIARRITLHKTGPSTEIAEPKRTIDDKPSSVATPQDLPREFPSLPAETPPSQGPSLTTSQRSLSKESTDTKKAPTTAEKTRSLPEQSPSTKTTPAIPEKKSTPVLGKKLDDLPRQLASAQGTPQPSTEATMKTKVPENSKLAARLNPALAGFLSRSGSPRPTGDATSNDKVLVTVQDTRPRHEETSASSVELTHVTKGRAKGPKRRAPKASSDNKSASLPTDSTVTSQVEVSRPNISQVLQQSTWPPASKPTEMLTPAREQPSVGPKPSKPTPRKPSATIDVPRQAAKSSEKVTVNADLPSSGASDQRAGNVDGSGTHPVTAFNASAHRPKPQVSGGSMDLRKEAAVSMTPSPKETGLPVKPTTPKKFAVLSNRPTHVSSPPESDGEKQHPSLLSPAKNTLPLTPSKSKLNTPKPSYLGDDAKGSPSATQGKVSGLGLQLESSTHRTATTPELTPPPEPDTRNRPLPAKPLPSKPSPSKPVPAEKSPSKVKIQLQTFFGALPQSSEKAEFDTQAFLSSQNTPQEKARTMNTQIWEVTGDGKRMAMPPQQEHILFEDCMYLCSHTMQSSAGSKVSETYLWCGDEVSEAAIEDAQLFCRKVARDNSSKLEVVKQGKESSEFFQALGGIIIIRKSKSSALYMICGRRHLGHIAFDEVNFATSSLSSGFPFLISAKFGKLYLWKGLGSNQEDVGCARLIGMDLGLTGEIEEVSEGDEPAPFWDSFPSDSRSATPTSPHKASVEHKGHSSRLYRIEHDRPKSSGGFWGLRPASPSKQPPRAVVEEVSPFSQNDLDASHIYILDLYSAVYVIVGSSAKKPAEFVSAVQIAQEIAMLCPSVQDRPLIPSCYVLFGEPPEEVRASFRKWSSSRAAPGSAQICVRVEEMIRELGLSL